MITSKKKIHKQNHSCSFYYEHYWAMTKCWPDRRDTILLYIWKNGYELSRVEHRSANDQACGRMCSHYVSQFSERIPGRGWEDFLYWIHHARRLQSVRLRDASFRVVKSNLLADAWNPIGSKRGAGAANHFQALKRKTQRKSRWQKGNDKTSPKHESVDGT